MRRTRRHLPLWFLLAGLLGLYRPGAAQDVTVQASVDETTIGTEDRVFYTIEIQGASFSDIETPDPPATTNLALMQSTPGTQRNVSIINGQVSQNVAFRWMYRPLRQGSAHLGPTEVRIKGRTYRTAEIELSVVDQSQRPQRPAQGFSWPASPFDRDDGEEEQPTLGEHDLFIRAVPSATTVYQNEQVTIEYRLYFRQGIQLGQSRMADSWDAEGFWREDLDVESRPIPRVVVEDGLRYNTIVLKRVAVFPTRAGALQVDPLRIESEVYLPFGSRDPFARFFSGGRSRFEPVQLSSPPVPIRARPFPPGAPDSFRGAVGTFRMDVEVDQTDVEVGEPVEVQVSISGTGNLATLQAPTLTPPGVFEQYDPRVELSMTRSGQRVQGEKAFTYVLVPRSNGTFTLPPLAFTYLNPETDRYETLHAEARTLRVSGAPEPPPTASTSASGLPVGDIAGIMRSPSGWIRAERTPLHRSPWTYAALLAPLLAVGGLFTYRRHATRLATDPEYARSRMAHPAARKHLKQASALLQEHRSRLFYEELERAVLGFIGNRLNVAELGLTRQRLDDHLAAVGVPPDTRTALRSLLDACDQVRFAPVLPDRTTMEMDLARAGSLIVDLDRLFNETSAAQDQPPVAGPGARRS